MDPVSACVFFGPLCLHFINKEGKIKNQKIIKIVFSRLDSPDFLTWMLTLGGLAGGVRFALRPAMICVRLQFGYRFMNRMKPASDTNMPEGTVMDLRSARHLPPFSAESGHREGDDGYQSKGLQWRKRRIQLQRN